MKLIIELASKKDVVDVFNLSNDSTVRRNSINQTSISWDIHVEWFEQKSTDSKSFFYVIRNQLNDFVGYVRFDKHENQDYAYIITIHLAEKFRGLGLGPKIVKMTTEKLFKKNCKAKVYADIKANNISSIRCFEKAMYKILERDKKISNELYYVMMCENNDDKN